MQKYAVLLSYVGSRYYGWQKQIQRNKATGESKDRVSIQGTIQEKLQRITGESPSVVGSGRTDAGVHAVGQVAHFVLKEKVWDPEILTRALNSTLPDDIQVLSLKAVDLDFHAQRSAVKKQYSYYFLQGPCSVPHLGAFSWWIRKTLNDQAMRQALDTLKGEHDFKPFQGAGAKPVPTVRKIFEAEITREKVGFPEVNSPCELVRVRLVGSGFLKQMVRGIAGTLLQVGEGRRDPACMEEILRTRDRNLVGPTAPGRALWLERVWYEKIDFAS